MDFVAGVLVILSGLIYAAGHHELGTLGADVCRCGGWFCQNLLYGLAAAGLWHSSASAETFVLRFRIWRSRRHAPDLPDMSIRVRSPRHYTGAHGTMLECRRRQHARCA
jgi:hypothetical protein